jgi:hypothetical protein
LSIPDTTADNEGACCEIFPLSIPYTYDKLLSTVFPLSPIEYTSLTVADKYSCPDEVTVSQPSHLQLTACIMPRTTC